MWDDFEAYLATRDTERGANLPARPLCFWCGQPCSGNTTENIDIDPDCGGEVSICDDLDSCLDNCRDREKAIADWTVIDTSHD